MRTIVNGFVIFLFVLGALQVNKIIDKNSEELKVLGDSTVFSSMCSWLAYGQQHYCVGSTLPSSNETVSNVLVRASNTDATVTWNTDRSSIGFVEYGTTPASLLLRAPESTQTTNHKVVLSPLRANVNYYYRIRIGESVFDNNGIPYSFKTTK